MLWAIPTWMFNNLMWPFLSPQAQATTWLFNLAEWSKQRGQLARMLDLIAWTQLLFGVLTSATKMYAISKGWVPNE